MIEHPIIFNGEMVRAIQAGRKTQTRRVITRPEQWMIEYDGVEHLAEDKNGDTYRVIDVCPYGQPGDRLWIRETFAYAGKGNGITAIYADDDRFQYLPHKPSIHMPRWASRITLEIVDIRAERVQDMSENDAYAEGIQGGDWLGDPIGEFIKLWDSINLKRGYGWAVNPWVWVVKFKAKRESAPV